MEIKKYSQPAINQNISTEQKETSGVSTSQSKLGSANVKDQFETVRPDPLKAMLSDSSTSPVSSRNHALSEAKQKFTNFLSSRSEISTAQGNSEMGDIFATMMSYLKMVQKESREDRKIQGMSNQAELAMKESKLELEKQKIEQMKTEAGERFDHAMDAATTEMVTSVVSGVAQIASQIKNEVAAKSQDEGEQKRIDQRYQSFISWLNDKDD